MAEFNITNKIRVTPADKSQWCFNFSDTDDEHTAYAFCVDLNEGISIPFKAAITVLCKERVSRVKLYELLGKKVEFSLVQEKASTAVAAQKRVRRYEGIVSSAVFGGKILTVGDESSAKKTCYRYELCVEPEMVKMGFVRKIRNWTSDQSISTILKTIFNDYNMEVVIPQTLFSQGDERYAILKSSGFVFEQNETDLDFINRLCRNFSLNYTFAYEEQTHTPPKYLVHFSRSFNTLPNLPVYTDENLSEHAASPKDSYFVFNTEISGSRDQSFSRNTVFSAAFEGVLNESCLNEDVMKQTLTETGYAGGADYDALSIAKELIEEYRSSAAARISINRRSRCLINAADLLYVPGSMITVREEDDDTGADDKWIVVRETLRFNSNYPKKIFGYSDTLAADEGRVQQKLACIPLVLNSSDRLDTLGAMNVFDRLKWETSLPEVLALADKGHEEKRLKSTLDLYSEKLSLVEGVVCDSDGNTKEETADSSKIIPSDANMFYPNKFYLKLKGSSRVVIAEYVLGSSSEDYASIIPKVGNNVLVMYSENRYFFMGYMANAPALNSYAIDLIREKKGSKSLSLKKDNSFAMDISLNGIEVSGYDSGQARIKDAILKGTLTLGIIIPLGNTDNTTGYKKFFISDEYTMNLKKITEQDSQGVISDDPKTETFRKCTLDIVERIVSDREQVTALASTVRKKLLDNEDAGDVQNLYELYRQSLANDLDQLDKLSKEIHSRINSIKSQLGLPDF